MASLLNPITAPQVGELAKALHARGIGSEGFQSLIDNVRPIYRELAKEVCPECHGWGVTGDVLVKSPGLNHESVCRACCGSGLKYIKKVKSNRGFWVPGFVTPGHAGWSFQLASHDRNWHFMCNMCGSLEVYFWNAMPGLYGCATCHTNTTDQFGFSRTS